MMSSSRPEEDALTTPATSFDVRAALEDLLERDLLRPWNGATEELPPSTTPGERYLLGRLVPRQPEGAEPVTDAEQALARAASLTCASRSPRCRRRAGASNSATWSGPVA